MTTQSHLKETPLQQVDNKAPLLLWIRHLLVRLKMPSRVTPH